MSFLSKIFASCYNCQCLPKNSEAKIDQGTCIVDAKNCSSKIKNISESPITQCSLDKKPQNENQPNFGTNISKKQIPLDKANTACFINPEKPKRTFPKKLVLTQEEIENSPKITIKNINSDLLSPENNITLNANGIIIPKKENNTIGNGLIYFGGLNSKKYNKDIHYELNFPNDDMKRLQYEFVVFYVREINYYYIKFDNKLWGVNKDNFNKNDNDLIIIPHEVPIPLVNKEYLIIEERVLFLNPSSNGMLDIISYDDNKEDKESKVTFFPQKKEIILGEESNCTFPFEIKNTKGFQLRIQYVSALGHWQIKNYSMEEKEIAYLLGYGEYPVYDNMIIAVRGKTIVFSTQN